MRNTRNTEIKGHALTAQRELLLSLIREADRHIDAKELYRQAAAKAESISLATVYRSLRLFQELGLVEERRLGQVRGYYEIKRGQEHQHLICQSCGKVIEFESSLIHPLVDSIQREHNFKVVRTELNLEGYCPQCKKTV